MTESSVVVTNTGPLIALATVRRVALLGQMYGSVLVPEAVFQEVTAQGPHRPGAAELASAPWAIRSTLLAPPDPFLAGNLGKDLAENNFPKLVGLWNSAIVPTREEVIEQDTHRFEEIGGTLFSRHIDPGQNIHSHF